MVIDTREQLPWGFGKPRRRELQDGGVIEYALDAGDYAPMVDGEVLPMRIERKSMPDWFGAVGKGRKRFERELEKMKTYRSYLIIEASAEEIRAGYERSLVSGEAALGSALAFSIDYGVMPIFASNRRTAQRIASGLLEEYAIKTCLQRTAA